MTERDDNDLHAEFFPTPVFDSGILDDPRITETLRDRWTWEARLAEDREYFKLLRAKRLRAKPRVERSPIAAADDRGFAPAVYLY